MLIQVAMWFNPLNAKLNPICHLLALIGSNHIFHVSRVRVKVGQQRLKCWDCRYKFSLGRGCSLFVFVLCCVDSSISNKLIIQSEQTYQVCVSVYMCVCERARACAFD